MGTAVAFSHAQLATTLGRHGSRDPRLNHDPDELLLAVAGDAPPAWDGLELGAIEVDFGPATRAGAGQRSPR